MAEGLITWIGYNGSESLEDSIVGHEAEHCVFSNLMDIQNVGTY